MWQLYWDMFLKTEHAAELRNSLFPRQQRTADISFYCYYKELLLALAYNTLCCFFCPPPAFARTTFVPGSKQQYTPKNEESSEMHLCVYLVRKQVLILKIVSDTSTCFKNESLYLDVGFLSSRYGCLAC